MWILTRVDWPYGIDKMRFPGSVLTNSVEHADVLVVLSCERRLGICAAAGTESESQASPSAVLDRLAQRVEFLERHGGKAQDRPLVSRRG